MLTHCANPECAEEFKYFGEGKLFLDNPGDALGLSQQQLYERCSWLCKRCSELFEVQFQSGKPRLVARVFRKAANL